MSQQQSKFPYITVGISILLGCLFLVFFFLAVSNQPDYMPSQQKQNIQKIQPAHSSTGLPPLS
ncbi:cbb3-type cytochrome oxidase assembly protein [Acinetobacter junii]|jgi:hypothetical protein|uniref:Uncharacterized protein n=1 Tax=Acinetobacter junii SH205 TaxID=575587 RepID=D0SJB4_ACIJU|nr:cbb3-type cytochrome oxidase assembly protein [Acinetobacter junii]APU48501.1 hypothetical protein BVL33_08335 [Acinetobacter junii]EEY93936.1 hypothetical protein HMPREF0026_01212 [Acinetobacter junii SH205]MCU4406818.1 cbb3-type cytochrome oxidase assembly protein [Acinetobacter junii]MDH0668395.1 cbb3-type cytochrome oxidase assembly protein [Acinetobacter junii]MDH1377534.1 cbb3-type cytochrome oxidase assembly protein [Acinetobacter junii]